MPDMTGGFDLGGTLGERLLNAVTRAYLRIWVPPWDSRRAAEPGSNTTRCFLTPWLSLLNGVTSRLLLQYNQLTVPTALVYLAAAGENPGVPQTSVLSRELDRTRVEDTNTSRTEARAAHEAELRNDFFVSLEIVAS